MSAPEEGDQQLEMDSNYSQQLKQIPAALSLLVEWDLDLDIPGDLREFLDPRHFVQLADAASFALKPRKMFLRHFDAHEAAAGGVGASDANTSQTTGALPNPVSSC